MSANMYKGTAGELLRLTEDRGKRLGALHERYRRLPWWKVCQRRRMRKRAGELISEIERLVEWSAIDGDLP